MYCLAAFVLHFFHIFPAGFGTFKRVARVPDVSRPTLPHRFTTPSPHLSDCDYSFSSYSFRHPSICPFTTVAAASSSLAATNDST